MPKSFINASLLTVTGAVIGFTYHVLNRGNRNVTETNRKNATDVPAWEKSLHRAAGLPWHYLHPAGQFVTNENLDKVINTARALRNQHITPAADADIPTPTFPEPDVEAPEVKQEAPGQPKPTTRPLGQPKVPGSREETLAHFSGLLDQAKTTATDVAKRYQEDPEFRATVNQAAQLGSSAIANLRKQASRRTGGTPRA